MQYKESVNLFSLISCTDYFNCLKEKDTIFKETNADATDNTNQDSTQHLTSITKNEEKTTRTEFKLNCKCILRMNYHYLISKGLNKLFLTNGILRLSFTLTETCLHHSIKRLNRILITKCTKIHQINKNLNIYNQSFIYHRQIQGQCYQHPLTSKK